MPLFLTTIDLDNGFLILGVIIVLIIIGAVGSRISELKKEKSEFELKFTQQQLAFEKVNSDLKLNVNTLAQTQFEQFKNVELEGYQKRMDSAAIETSQVLLQRWLFENEDRIRKDAANRSVRNVMGKVTEHLIPFSEAFSQFNPKDARFIGSPIDLIVFDGAEEKKEEITIYFIEIKTGTSALSTRQKRIMEAVTEKRVKWLRLTVKDFGDEVNKSLGL